MLSILFSVQIKVNGILLLFDLIYAQVSVENLLCLLLWLGRLQITALTVASFWKFNSGYVLFLPYGYFFFLNIF
jgi:hypothetical protein